MRVDLMKSHKVCWEVGTFHVKISREEREEPSGRDNLSEKVKTKDICFIASRHVSLSRTHLLISIGLGIGRLVEYIEDSFGLRKTPNQFMNNKIRCDILEKESE